LQQAFRCPKCGAQIPVGQQFCGTCGQHFEYRCHHCGTAVRSLHGFCPSCGGKLYQQTQLAEPSARKATKPLHEKARQTTSTPHPLGQVGRYLIVIAIIVFLGAILYTIGTSPQAESSNWFGNFVFGGKLPPSTPPITDGQQKPKPTSDSPSYTVDQVIAAAKKLSPDCRAPTRRTG
jgi:hypothetical protein